MLLASGVAVGDVTTPGVSAEVAAENQQATQEAFRIRVANSENGPIEVSRDAGASWVRLGWVVAPATRVNPKGFTASKWAADSAVCASAVNAVCNHPKSGRGVIFSLIPAGQVIGAAQRQASSVIVTDIKGGDGIFGGGVAPYVNSPVRIARDGAEQPLPRDYVPSEGDELLAAPGDGADL